MNFPFYKKTVPQRPSEPVTLPPSRPTSEIKEETYMPDDGLVDAVNVALLLGQPLLLTGEPGTGKTHLAYHVAWQFGLEVLKFETKSDHKAQDLFYIYDALRHFHAVQVAQARNQDTPNVKDFLDYTALGKAIILANELKTVKEFLPTTFIKEHPGKPQRSVVLIDEIDKAPRDFPNDILNEVEHYHFHVPELNTTISVEDEQFKPILILTSNSEKHLPAAFLRRCVYYNIPFPKEEVLKQIVESRLGDIAKNSSEFLPDALALFHKLREQPLKEKPATAKLLNWLMTLHKMFKDSNNTEYKYPDALSRTLSTLVTNTDDQKLAEDILKDWLNDKK
ncbi:MoxR family ATPase [Candidatus Parabeggiatoa sp. HSG14]|uniref:AAA family ATPase n=1 Tax=Candidatus Parabeggiatoa sp. HSG14 TaxID=3055593 RepID=UPI0025A7332E|nr:MoxR family ATPase [Thiotrichales bacterium HSG14]